MCPRAAQNHRCRPNHNGLSRFLIFYFVFFCFCWFSGCFLVVFCEMPWKLATQGLSSCSQNTPNLPKELPKSPEELPQSTRRHRRGPLLSSAPLCLSPCLPPTLCLPLPSRLSSPLLSFPRLSSPLFLSSLCVSSPQALPEEKARRTARERLNNL